MIRKYSFPLPIFILILTLAAASGLAGASANAADLSQEYEQVRKIASRDPKVKDAFDRANERLQEKIVELDPALKFYHPGHAPVQAPARGGFQSPPAVHAAPVHSATINTPPPAPHHSAPKIAATHTMAPAAAVGAHRTHIVAPGETIGGIASKYQVSAASIELANHITDPRKLRAGQTLIIPGKGSAAVSAPAPAVVAAPAPASHRPAQTAASAAPTAAESQQDSGIWDKLKHSF